MEKLKTDTAAETCKALYITPEEIDVASALVGMDGSKDQEHQATTKNSTCTTAMASSLSNATSSKFNHHSDPYERRKGPKPKIKLPIEIETIHEVPKRKDYVNHTYRDSSIIVKELNHTLKTDINQMSFGEKLHHILNTKEYNILIQWMPHGRAFRVLLPQPFENVVCVKYFGHRRYSSFLRQLNNHGFKHITKGTDRNCYYEEFFLRGLPHLCKYMPQPRDARRLIPDPENEPDFYALSEQYPLPSSNQATARSQENNDEGDDERKPRAITSLPGTVTGQYPTSDVSNQPLLEIERWYHNLPVNDTPTVAAVASPHEIEQHSFFRASVSPVFNNNSSTAFDAASLLRARLASQVSGIGDVLPFPKRQAMLPITLSVTGGLTSEQTMQQQQQGSSHNISDDAGWASRIQEIIIELENQQLKQLLHEQQRRNRQELQQQQQQQDELDDKDALLKAIIRHYANRDSLLALPCVVGSLNHQSHQTNNNNSNHNSNRVAIQRLLHENQQNRLRPHDETRSSSSTITSSSLIDLLRSNSQNP